MKKEVFLMIATSLCLGLLYGCAGEASTYDTEVDTRQFDVDIAEEYLAATVHYILQDFDDYVGKTVRFEGIFEYFGNETIYRTVLRRAGT